LFFVYIAPFDYFWRNQRVFLPYFIAGIFLKNSYQFLIKHIGKILACSILLYLSFLPFWGINYWSLPKLFLWKYLHFEFQDIKSAALYFPIMLSRIMLFFSLFYYIFKERRGVNHQISCITAEREQRA
jgi:hypothetical protein